MIRFYSCLLCIALACQAGNGFGQHADADTAAFTTVAAGMQYNKPSSFQKRWGKNRRVEWTTPVTVPLIWLDSTAGGLEIYKAGGGGNETRSLRLRSADKKEYVLRSINKSRDEVIPAEVKGTFIGDIIQDGVSMSHPYGAFALAKMQDAAGIHHTHPRLVYLPEQKALDTLNKEYANDLYMFEERPDEDWSDAPHLGGFKNYSSTENAIEDLLEDYRNKANQFLFAKTRLFDILVGDWDRHADNFRWGREKKDDIKWFEPVPRDRDQVFFTHNGKWIDKMIKLGGLNFMQHFSPEISHVSTVPTQQKDFDKFFTNSLTLADWKKAAAELQAALTDEVMDASLRGMPPEIYAVSGKGLLQTLTQRRSQLENVAASYYAFLAAEVDIPLSKGSEVVEITSPGDGYLQVKVFYGDIKDALYNRTFYPGETQTINIYGIDGEDKYVVKNNSSTIALNIFGGPGRDSVIQVAGNRIHVFDKGDNVLQLVNAAQPLSKRDTLPAYHFESTKIPRPGFFVHPYLFLARRNCSAGLLVCKQVSSFLSSSANGILLFPPT